MKFKIVILVSLIVANSCNFKEKLPKPEHIPFNKTAYNGFYKLGENGKRFILITNQEAKTYNIIKDDYMGLNNIKKASVGFDSFQNKPMITIKFNKKGETILYNLTKKLIGKQLAVIFNNKLLMCPTVQSQIHGGNLQISGNFSLQEAVNITNYINLNKYITKSIPF